VKHNFYPNGLSPVTRDIGESLWKGVGRASCDVTADSCVKKYRSITVALQNSFLFRLQDNIVRSKRKL